MRTNRQKEQHMTTGNQTTHNSLSVRESVRVRGYTQRKVGKQWPEWSVSLHGRATQLVVSVALALFTALGHASEGITFYHWDALGSPVAATDEQGNIEWREQYRPYGERIKNQTAAQNNTRWYTGHPHNNATGLTYAGARYYDPVVGRFMGVDPQPFVETDLQTFNRYAYASNNPYKFIDPDGEKIRFAPGSTREFQQRFAQIVQYLNAGDVSGTLARLEARPEIVLIQESATPHGFHYDLGTMTIVFDPLSGLEVADGEVQTPALGVLHEAAHALQHVENPKQLLKDIATPVPLYDNREEQRVIRNIETPAARKLGEPVRQHHGGRAITVQCPICTE